MGFANLLSSAFTVATVVNRLDKNWQILPLCFFKKERINLLSAWRGHTTLILDPNFELNCQLSLERKISHRSWGDIAGYELHLLTDLLSKERNMCFFVSSHSLKLKENYTNWNNLSLVFLLISNLTNGLHWHQFLGTKTTEANKSLKTNANRAH